MESKGLHVLLSSCFPYLDRFREKGDVCPKCGEGLASYREDECTICSECGISFNEITKVTGYEIHGGYGDPYTLKVEK